MARADSDVGSVDVLSLFGSGTVLAILVAVMFVILLVGVVAWIVVHRVRKSGVLDRFRGGVESAVQNRLLRLRAETGEEAVRDLARARLRLNAAVDATRRSVDLARAEQRPVGALPAILSAVTRAGVAVDAQLRLAESEPDEPTRRSLVTLLSGQVAKIEETCRDIRTVLVQSGSSVPGADLSEASRRLRVEVPILESWARAYADPGDHDHLGQSGAAGPDEARE